MFKENRPLDNMNIVKDLLSDKSDYTFGLNAHDQNNFKFGITGIKELDLLNKYSPLSIYGNDKFLENLSKLSLQSDFLVALEALSSFQKAKLLKYVLDDERYFDAEQFLFVKNKSTALMKDLKGSLTILGKGQIDDNLVNLQSSGLTQTDVLRICSGIMLAKAGIISTNQLGNWIKLKFSDPKRLGLSINVLKGKTIRVLLFSPLYHAFKSLNSGKN
jgi:hypothetical protein